jgi:NDP-sugar pyrophosphorylase family protein
MFRPEDFFELKLFKHRELFDGVEHVWEVLKKIKPYIEDRITPNLSVLEREGVMLTKTRVLYQGTIMDGELEIMYADATKGELRVFRGKDELKGASVLYAGSFFFHNGISIGQGSVVEPGALVRGPVIIGSNTEIRQGAYVRGNCIVGDRCVVGHTTEMKNAVMFNDAKAGHFAYIGDSVLGNNVNLGAGTKCANLKLTGSEVVVRAKRKTYETGLRKFGVIFGDNVETGCNSVTSPGVLMGKSSLVYPNVNVPSGYYPYRSIMSGKKARK